ncbi:hypothetical protein L7F22_060700 [Adiantum nelumboides]|nr:hypothetical protein [Adiantum nelumboides]
MEEFDYAIVAGSKLLTWLGNPKELWMDGASEFDYATVAGSKLLTWLGNPKELWMDGASECGSLKREECILERPMEDDDYVFEPFSKENLEPFRWDHILATLFVCATTYGPTTKLCNKNGYNVVPYYGISVITEGEAASSSKANTSKGIRLREMRTLVQMCTMAKKAAADVGSTIAHSSSSKPKDTTLEGKSEIVALPSRKAQNPKQKRFCYTQEELHEEHGLILEGKLYQHLNEADVTEEDWLSIFKKKQEKGSKIFLHMMRPEYVEDCTLLFHKVYQAVPANREITHKFATLFAYEQCPAARQDPTSQKVAWAYFGEQVLDHCKKLPGGIDKKCLLNKPTSKGAGGADAGYKKGCIKGYEHNIGHNESRAIRQEPRYVEDTGDILIHGSASRPIAEALDLKASMEGAIDATHPDYLVIEGKVATLNSVLTALGVDASSSNIRDEVDHLKVSLSPFLGTLIYKRESSLVH